MFEIGYFSIVEPAGKKHTALYLGIFGVLLAIKPEKKLPSDAELESISVLLKRGHAFCYYGFVIRYLGGF